MANLAYDEAIDNGLLLWLLNNSNYELCTSDIYVYIIKRSFWLSQIIEIIGLFILQLPSFPSHSACTKEKES